MPIRTMKSSEVARALAINEASVPDVESLSEEHIRELFESSELPLVAGLSDDDVVGFGFVVGRGAPSEILRTAWAMARDDVDLHLERIAFERSASGFGLGVAFYDRLDQFAGARAAATDGAVRLSSFVTVEPLVRHSLNFHRSRGFVEIDRLRLDETAVALMQKVYVA